jgi:hypothetical protein
LRNGRRKKRLRGLPFYPSIGYANFSSLMLLSSPGRASPEDIERDLWVKNLKRS